MFALYMKSADEHTVVKVTNKISKPAMSAWYLEHGYSEIGENEFKKIRARLKRKQRVTTGYGHSEKELQENLIQLQAQHAKV